jgi:2'-5' RNA ligase
MTEKICSIIVELPNKEQNYLNQNIENICRQYNLSKKENFHLSVESSFRCRSEKFRNGLENLSKKQSTFDVQFNRINLFENNRDKLGLVYITTDDDDKIRKLTELHEEVKKIISVDNGKTFVPHISLIDWGPINDVIDVVDKLQINNINLQINELCLQKKIDFKNWKPYGRFSLTGESFTGDDFIEREELSLVFE